MLIALICFGTNMTEFLEQRFVKNYLFKSSRSLEFSESGSLQIINLNLNLKSLGYKEKFTLDEKGK